MDRRNPNKLLLIIGRIDRRRKRQAQAQSQEEAARLQQEETEVEAYRIKSAPIEQPEDNAVTRHAPPVDRRSIITPRTPRLR